MYIYLEEWLRTIWPSTSSITKIGEHFRAETVEKTTPSVSLTRDHQGTKGQHQGHAGAPHLSSGGLQREEEIVGSGGVEGPGPCVPLLECTPFLKAPFAARGRQKSSRAPVDIGRTQHVQSYIYDDIIDFTLLSY
jgi:hypothetical protein